MTSDSPRPSLARSETLPLALALVALTLLARLALAAIVPLVPDEAYYALWSTSLSAGYFDHPPMIAWFIRAGTELFGPTPFGVRFVSVLATIPASLFIYDAARQLLADSRAAIIAVLLFNLTLLGFFGLAVATPDAPLILFSAAMLWSAARLSASERPLWWIATGIFTGFALLSKYSAALSAAGFGIAVLLVPEWRRRLVSAWPWAALAAAILVFSPNLVWNATHGWETVLKQGGRTTENWQFQPQYLLEFIGAQLGLATPLLLVFAVAGLLPRFRKAFRGRAAYRLVLALVLVPMAYFVFHALRSRVEGNWPSFLYPVLAVSAAGALASIAADGETRFARLRRATVPLALAITGLAVVYTVTVPTWWLGQRDPMMRLSRGWDSLGEGVAASVRATGARYVLTFDYQLNAELAWLLPDIPVVQVNESRRYDFLGRDRNALVGPGLVVSSDPLEPALVAAFGAAERVATVPRSFRGVSIADYYVARVDRPAPGPLPSLFDN